MYGDEPLPQCATTTAEQIMANRYDSVCALNDGTEAVLEEKSSSMKPNPFWPASKHSNRYLRRMGERGDLAPLLAAGGPKYEALPSEESA